jgi:hypothetical protein
VPERLRTGGIVLVPAVPVVGLFVYWAAHQGGYLPTTWEASALVVLGLLVAAVLGIGPDRVRLARPTAIALALLGAYVAWSYCSIAWAASPGDALDGSNRALLFLLLFALFAVLPWRPGTARWALTAFALGTGVLAVVTLVRLGTAGDVATLFSGGRLISPIGYVNGTPALFLMTAVVSVGLAAQRELPVALRGLLLAGATAALDAAVLSQSRGWLFSLPIVLALAIALVPDRLRHALWGVPPVLGTLVALPALLHVFERSDAASTPAAGVAALEHASRDAAGIALPLCAAVLVLGIALALLDRRVQFPARVTVGASRIAAGVALTGVLAAVVAGVVATDGRPDRAIADYFDRSNGYESGDHAGSRFTVVGSNRPDFWRVSLRAVAAHPLGGLGQDNWADYYLRRRDSGEQPRWTHSLELRLLAHTGVVGFLLFAGFLTAGLAAALRGRRRAGREPSALAAIALLPLVVWLVHGSVDWFWEIPALSGPAFAFLGLATALMRPDHGASPARPAVVRGAGFAAAAGAVLAALVLALPYVAERETSAASRSWIGDPGRALARLHRAADLNPLSARPNLSAGVIALEVGLPSDARSEFDRALARHPDDWFGHLGRALAETAVGDRAAARRDYARAHAASTGPNRSRSPRCSRPCASMCGASPALRSSAISVASRYEDAPQRLSGRAGDATLRRNSPLLLLKTRFDALCCVSGRPTHGWEGLVR